MTPISEIIDLAMRFGINSLALSILIFGLYYRRHGDRVLVTTAAMFNIFAFAVLGQLASIEFSLAAGFGLFAILALFNLRSEPIGNIEIAYFFGSVAIAVICSVGGTPILNIVVVTGIVLIGVYIVDHPALMHGSRAMKVTLDRIDPNIVSDPAAMLGTLSARLGVTVTGFEIINLNYVNEMATVSLTYREA